MAHEEQKPLASMEFLLVYGWLVALELVSSSAIIINWSVSKGM